MIEIQSGFKDAMKHMYPDGVYDVIQIRDLVRTFVMGCCEYGMHLVRVGVIDKEKITPEMEKLLEYASKMVDVNWIPDKTWKW